MPRKELLTETRVRGGRATAVRVDGAIPVTVGEE